MDKRQKKIFMLCWCAYASAYLCRTNLSIAMPKMISDFGWDKTSGGLVGSVFFWAYAIGQLINGYIGDKVKSRPFIFIALAAASIINIMVGFLSSKALLITLWGINGFLLSMLWGPIVKILSRWFPPDKNNDIAVGISTSMIGGYLISWGLVGQIMNLTTWQWAFWIPGIIVLIFSFVWLIGMSDDTEKAQLSVLSKDDYKSNPMNTQENVQFSETMSLKDIIFGSKLWLIALACIAQGVIKDGITLWGPTFLGEIKTLNPQMVAAFSLFIPIMSLFGIFFAGWLNKKMQFQEKKAIILLLAGTAISCFALYFSLKMNIYISTLFLSIASALAYGANTLLLTIIPLNFAKYNKASAVAGFLDFCSYMGAALAGVLTGYIADNLGWGMVVVMWVILALVGAVGLFITGSRNNAEKHQKVV